MIYRLLANRGCKPYISHTFAGFITRLLQKPSDQQKNIVFVLTLRWQINRGHIEAAIEIHAEFPFFQIVTSSLLFAATLCTPVKGPGGLNKHIGTILLI